MFAKFSADEKSIAYVVKENLKNNIKNRSTSSNIFIEDLEKGTTRKLTTSEGKEKLIEVLQTENNLNVFLISHDFTHPLIDKISITKNENISSIQ